MNCKEKEIIDEMNSDNDEVGCSTFVDALTFNYRKEDATTSDLVAIHVAKDIKCVVA